jgi:hypothetical protein
MIEYPHIDSVYKRDERGKFILGDYSQPEFEYLKDLPWVWTEKIDGTNIRVMYKGKAVDEITYSTEYTVTFGGKTNNAQIPAKLLEHLQETFPLEKMQEAFAETDVCLYGEGYGAGIQKAGGLYSPEQKFILFDVRIGHWWLEREKVLEIAQQLNLDVVPDVGICSLKEMVRYVSDDRTPEGEKHLTKVPTSSIGTAPTEGYVGTPKVSLLKRNAQRIITKIKFRDFV